MIEDQMTPERFSQLAPAIQQKILNARAAAERREAKKEDRDALKSWLRFKELEAIPVKQRSRDEHNEYQRLRRQQKKLEEKGETTVAERVEERVKSAEQFWALNRASVSSQKISEYKAREEVVLDMLAWFDRLDEGTETPELCGEDFVGVAEGLPDVLTDIRDNGVAHLGYIHDDEDEVIPADCWDGYFTGRAFWKTPEVFRALCADGEPTRVFTLTGILIALPDWRVVDFLERHCGWKRKDAQKHVGMKFGNSTTRVKY